MPPESNSAVTAVGVQGEYLDRAERAALCRLPRGLALVSGLLGGSLARDPWGWAWSLGSAGLGCQDLSSRDPETHLRCEEREAGPLLPSRQPSGRSRL